MLSQDTDHRKVIKPKALPGLVILFLLISDVGGAYLSFSIAAWVRKLLIPWLGGQVSWSFNLPIVLLGIGFIILLFAFSNLYPGYGKTAVKEIESVVKALSLVYSFLAVTVYFLKLNPEFPRSIFLFTWVLSILIIPLLRIILRNRLSLSDWYGKPIFFIINNQEDTFALESVRNCRRMGWRPLAVHILDLIAPCNKVLGLPVVPSIDQIFDISREYSSDTVVFSMDLFSGTNQKHLDMIRKLSAYFNSIILVSSTYEFGSIWIKVRDLEGYLGLELKYNLLLPGKLAIKRIVDIAGSMILILVTFPIWIIIGVLIKIDTEGFVFYNHLRIGKDGNGFQMLKFRTMIVNADEKLMAYLDANSKARQEWQDYQKLKEDPRITKIGFWLRKFSVDELPQIWNVLKGEMSLIGPRAVTAEELGNYGDFSSLILRVKPGITGWWQVMGRNETTWDHRKRLEVYYVSNWSLWMDAYIALKTIWVIVSGQGR